MNNSIEAKAGAWVEGGVHYHAGKSGPNVNLSVDHHEKEKYVLLTHPAIFTGSVGIDKVRVTQRTFDFQSCQAAVPKIDYYMQAELQPDGTYKAFDGKYEMQMVGISKSGTKTLIKAFNQKLASL
ncbi:hypothetical protein TrCOL_g5554 [Triparma columacea]|uniref:Uncharacterized protein n=1 Tax=Triparma columacea TaxID=722753 RepID=A0A9W7LFA5_9STRA|nr:hypothetical protein TrCOL_g5554 [Triparma columacea]